MQALLESEYVKAILVIVIGSLVLFIVNIILKRRIKTLEEKQQTGKKSSNLTFLRFFKRIAIPLAFLAVLTIATEMVSFNEQIQNIVKISFSIIMTFIIVRSLNKSMELAFSRYFEHDWANHTREKNLRPLLSLIKFVLWILGILFLLANLGMDVSTALAGLGVGGIAVAIAAQGILGDLFSYLVIFFDKPFELGDFIVFGDKSGVVERIGIKSIRIRVLSGELLIIANSDLTAARIHNYKQMLRRRVVFKVGVVYETPPDKLERIPSIIKDVIASVQTIEGVICDRSHFSAFGDFSLNFETVYYVPSSDYVIYMDTQQEIYFKLFRAFKAEGIEFAYPTQLVYTKDGAAGSAVTTEMIPSQMTK
ncbi:MAG: mechanosensitive ion channel family protein [Sphaerochaetaceae bacterium]